MIGSLCSLPIVLQPSVATPRAKSVEAARNSRRERVEGRGSGFCRTKRLWSGVMLREFAGRYDRIQTGNLRDLPSDRVERSIPEKRAVRNPKPLLQA